MKHVTLFGGVWLFAYLCNTQCVFKDTAGSGSELDLRALEHAWLTKSDSNFDYFYTPCRNGAQCPSSSGTDTGMAIQKKEDPDECSIFANWDNGDVQPSYSSLTNVWTFEYMNGNDCDGQPVPRQFYVYWNCDMTVGDYSVESAGQIADCSAEMYINSQWACPGEIYHPDSSSTISAGTIFLILFAAVLFLYFVIGWIICVVMNQKDRGFEVINNIPNIGFWTKLPALVWAGCCFTKDFCAGLCGAKAKGYNEITD